jgi:hypothetical protein
MTLEDPTSLLSTGDFASHLEGHRGLLKTLGTAQRRALVIDAGGFFGDTGYNRLGHGKVERRILTDLYDLCLPSVPGFDHYLNDPVLREKSLCANLTYTSHTPVFRPSRRVRVAGIDTLVLGILGEEEFEALAAAERSAMRWHPPARCVQVCAQAFTRRPNPTRRSAIVVVSHSGMLADHELAKACPYVNVIISASGHPEEHSVLRVGAATVVTSAAHGAGYAVIQPGAARWEASTMAFPADVAGRPRELLRPLHAGIEKLEKSLREPVGAVHPDYRHTTTTSTQLLTSLAHEMADTTGIDQAVFAQSLVRARPIGARLTRGQLLECIEHDEHLVTIELEISRAARLPASLMSDLGRLVVIGQLPRQGTARLLTSSAIAARVGAAIADDLGPVSSHLACVLIAPSGRAPESKRSSAEPTGVFAAAGPAA